MVWNAHSSSSFYPVAGSDGRYRSAPVFSGSSDLSPAVNMVDESCYQKMGSKDSVGRCTSDTRHILADWRRGNLALCLPPCGFFPDTSKERQTPFRFDYLSLSILYLLAIQLICYSTLLVQYPLMSVMTGINYYRVPMQYPGQKWGYDKDLYALLKLNEQVRNGKWEDIIHDAQENQVQVFYTSNCVNLALAQTRQLADRMFSFYQSGEDALLAPRTRDNMSMYPTMEAFWRLGLVNSSLRYASDLQASILNGKMSGRLMKRITECQIVNGKYAVARKNIDLLKQSLFYHDWAVKMEAMLGNDTAISHDPDLGRARRMRFKTEMIYSYNEIDKMMGLLFINNPDNKMALDYFMGQMLLKGDIQGFMRYGSWVQQYGGYMQMPVGYQDAVKCIQNQGNVPGSPYAEYVKRMMSKQKGGEE